MKSKRQDKILELIRESNIETQEELLFRLQQSGYTVTQATISRDLRELRISKTQTESGQYRYVCLTAGTMEATAKLNSLFSEAILSVTPAGNLVALRCHAGMAQAVCAALDASPQEDIVATLAGDDTIFILCPDIRRAKYVSNRIRQQIGR